MEVRPGRDTCRPDSPDHGARRHVLAAAHAEAREVCIPRLHAVAVANRDHVAEAAGVPAREEDAARACSTDPGPTAAPGSRRLRGSDCRADRICRPRRRGRARPDRAASGGGARGARRPWRGRRRRPPRREPSAGIPARRSMCAARSRRRTCRLGSRARRAGTGAGRHRTRSGPGGELAGRAPSGPAGRARAWSAGRRCRPTARPRLRWNLRTLRSVQRP